MTEEDIAGCTCRKDEQCSWGTENKRRFEFCDNAIDANCCPRGYTEEHPSTKGGEHR